MEPRQPRLLPASTESIRAVAVQSSLMRMANSALEHLQLVRLAQPVRLERQVRRAIKAFRETRDRPARQVRQAIKAYKETRELPARQVRRAIKAYKETRELPVQLDRPA